MEALEPVLRTISVQIDFPLCRGRCFEAQSDRLLGRRLAAAALGTPYPPVTPVVVDVALLRQYEGVYRVDMAATRTLRVVDGKLTAQRTGPRDELTAIADDTFVYPDGFNRLQVLRDATGKVTAMRFWPDGEGEGTVAPLTDQALPIDIMRPGEEIERLVGAYTAPVLVTSASIAMLCAMMIWRRRKRPSMLAMQRFANGQ